MEKWLSKAVQRHFHEERAYFQSMPWEHRHFIFTPHMKIHSKWIIELDVKLNRRKLLEENIAEGP
jgi:hypothetical protein